MSQSKSIPGDTPIKQNTGATGVFINGSLDEQRAAVLNDLGNIPEVTVDFMLDHIVPNSGINVERTIDRLKQEGVLLDTGWKEFSGALPKGSAGKEQKVFSKMGSIYEEIISKTEFDDVKSSRTPTLVLGTSPDIAPDSDTSVRTRPDACGQLNSNLPFHTSQCGHRPKAKENDYHWFNIAYVEEYKKKNTIKDLNDNVLKILWSLHHIMNVDRRRRFAFGATIENTDTRIWFCCRQIVFVTHRFDFMKEPAKLVRLISSLAYAKVAKLGYDPTMELFWKHNKWNYQITMEGKDNHGNVVTKVYKTIDNIADMSSNLRGRATRVYEAYDVGNRRSKVVIKDSWVDVTRPKEGDTLSELLKGASDGEKAMFLTVLHHGVVKIDGREDLTQDLLMNGYLVSTDPPKPNDKKGNSTSNLVNALGEMMAEIGIAKRGNEGGTTQDDHIYKASIFEVLKPLKPDCQPESFVTSPDVSTSSKTKPPPRVYDPKAHYRVVFKERGESLHNMSIDRKIKLPLALQVMHDILEALAFLTKKGYVHRDISPGNIIFYEGRAKLSDLEFTKQFESGASNHIRTGTYDFMAVEVEAGAYFNKPYFDQGDGVFSHNPLHDLESLWWVGVWFLLSHYRFIESPRDTTAQRHIEIVKTYGETIFNNRANTLSRRLALTGPDLLANIEPNSFITAVQHLIVLLNLYRKQLLTYYRLYQPTDRSFFIPDLHCEFSDIVENAVKELGNDQTELWTIKHVQNHVAMLNGNLNK